jgi:hypothetical protein
MLKISNKTDLDIFFYSVCGENLTGFAAEEVSTE